MTSHIPHLGVQGNITTKGDPVRQSINQGFRMVGSINAKYGTELVAFRTPGACDAGLSERLRNQAGEPGGYK